MQNINILKDYESLLEKLQKILSNSNLNIKNILDEVNEFKITYEKFNKKNTKNKKNIMESKIIYNQKFIELILNIKEKFKKCIIDLKDNLKKNFDKLKEFKNNKNNYLIKLNNINFNNNIINALFNRILNYIDTYFDNIIEKINKYSKLTEYNLKKKKDI